MSNMTNAHENRELDAVTGVTSDLSATMSIALFSADPTDAGLVTNELSGNGYARALLTDIFSANTGTDGVTSNTATLTHDTASGDWLPVTHIGYMLADVEGVADMEVVVALGSPITNLDTQAFTWEIGSLTVTAK